MFDVDDIDSAFAELDARYLAGQAVEHSHSWSAIASIYAAFNRHEILETIKDMVTVDHRPVVTIEPSDLAATISAAWDLVPDLSMRVEAVHRITALGAVVTNKSYGVSREGFDAEWRMAQILAVGGDAVTRFELFDEADLDVALARFDELNQPAQRLENVATRTWVRLTDMFNRRDMTGFLAHISADGHFDDRRKGLRDSVVGPALQNLVHVLFETVPTTWHLGVEPIAIRGSRLSLTREEFRDTDDADRPIVVEILRVTEVTEDGLVHGTVLFDPDDIDGAFAELDARYLAGEAAAHSHTWSAIVRALVGVNRHELPELAPDWVNIDRRRAIAFAPGDMTAYVRATWDEGPDGRAYIESVHRLSCLGAVVTQVGQEISPQGFEAEWRMINLMTVEGDRFNRSELFDEADLDAAVARFDELNR